MEIRKIDHIAIAVKDLDASISFYRDALQLPFHGVQTIESVGCKVAFFQCGEVELELIMAIKPEAHVNKHIAKHGEGLYHIAYRVDNAQEALSYCADKGLPVGSTVPQPGANNSLVGFIASRGAHGVLTELVEREEHHETF